MTIEQQLRSALTLLTDEIRPQADPLGRLFARRRRKRVGAATGVVAVVLTTALAAGLVGQLPAANPAPTPLGLAGWALRLVNAPPRGTVAAEPGFVSELAADLATRAALDRAGSGGGRQVRVLFADDVGTWRIALAAFVATPLATDRLLEDSVMAWLVGPRGAKPGALVGGSWQSVDLWPFMVEELPTDTVIGLAPPGCEVSTSSVADVRRRWQPAASGSYLLRAPAERRAEWWRVTCDDVVRYERPAPPVLDPNHPATVLLSDSDVTAGLVGTLGTPDLNTAQEAMASLVDRCGYGLAGRPKVVWGGRIANTPPGPAEVAVAVAPLIGGGWAGNVRTRFDSGAQSAVTLGGDFITDRDPRAPGSLLAIRLVHDLATIDSSEVTAGLATSLLVVAPTGTVTVRVNDADGDTIDHAVVANSFALTQAPARDGITVQAMSAGGAVIAETSPVGPIGLNDRGIQRWDD